MSLTLPDRLLRAVVRRAGALAQTPVGRILAPIRTAAAAHALAPRRAHADALGARIANGDGTARHELAALGESALTEMRAEVRRRAAVAGIAARLMAAGDAAFGDCREPEYLDDPDLDPVMRTRLMHHLDALNETIEGYDYFLEVLRPLLVPGRTTRVLDLAAGHAGFALAATRRAARHGLSLHITASDIKDEYLELGAEVARREGLDIAFVHQDALDLSNLSAGEYDVITCTQSLHHFPAGLVAVMFEAAARAAGAGVVFVDGTRSALTGVALYAYGNLRYRDPAFAHDAWVSARRFFVPEELALLARLGAWGDGVEARWCRPGHCLLRLRC